MSFNQPGSFFVPETPPTTKSQKASWEMTPTVQGSLFPSAHKMTDEEARVYKALMDTSSDSDGNVKTPTKMSPEGMRFYKEVTGHSYESDDSDDSVEVLNKEKIVDFEKKMEQKNKQQKRLQALRSIQQENKRAKVTLFVPSIVDIRLIFVRDHFVGVQNYERTRAVDNNGTVYKRVVLKDDTIAHNFVLSSEQLLYKIDGESVIHKTPGARGIVNITRTNRVPFSKLVAQTFDNDL